MDAIDFLRLVVADRPNKVTALLLSNGGFSHNVCDTYEQMVRHAQRMAKTRNVYFALGTLTEREVAKPDGTTATRVKTNIAYIKSLWLDIDVGEAKAKSGKGYADFNAGYDALDKLITTIGLPRPTVVSSGGGLHVYWPFKEETTQATWLPLADRLKSLVIAHGLRNDAQLIANCSNVLRVPGTINHKYGGAGTLVEVVEDGDGPTEISVLEDILKGAMMTAKQSGMKMPLAPKRIPTVSVNSLSADLANSLRDNTPADGEAIYNKCGQMQHVHDQEGKVSEPLWYAVVQLSRFTDEGLEFALSLSPTAESYRGNFETKWAQCESKNIGPTTCAKFEEVNPEVCMACKHRGRITSPIQLGRVIRDAPDPNAVYAETSVAEEAHNTGDAFSGQNAPVVPKTEISIPGAPVGYRRGEDGLYVKTQDADGDDIELRFYEQDLFPLYRYRDQSEKAEVVRLCSVTPMEGNREFDLKLEHVVDPRTMLGVLARNGVLVSGKNREHMAGYLMGYIKLLQATSMADNRAAAFGWNDDTTSFTTGQATYYADGRMVRANPSQHIHQIAKGMHSRGSLEAWSKGVSMFSKPGMEPFMLSFLTAFGAPLLRFTPHSGGTICLWGATAAGKTTALKAATSVWGSPASKDGLIASLNSTENAYYKRMSVMSNLPVCIDEITNMDTEVRGGKGKNVSQFCYSVSDGHEPDRCKANNGVVSFAERGSWQTIVLTTSNQSLHSKLSLAKSDAAAEILRVIDCHAPTGVLSKPEADHGMSLFLENYGIAGEVYAKSIAMRAAELRTMVPEFIRKFELETGGGSEERFWSAMMVCNLLGGKLAKELGLIDFDLRSMKNWCVETIRSMRVSRTNNVASTADVMSDFISEHTRNMVAVRDSQLRSSKDLPLVGNVSIMPTAAPLVMRYEEDSGIIHIHKRIFREYLLRKHLSPAQVMAWLEAKKIVVPIKGRVNLARGTNLPAMSTECISVNVKNPVLGVVTADGGIFNTVKEG